MRRLIALLSLILLPAIALAQAPPAANKLLTRIAFGSCANQEIVQPIWGAIRAYQPELFLFAGDNVYGDYQNGRAVTDDSLILGSIRHAYARQEAIPDFVAFRKEVPHLATWDDHDYGKNDGGVEFAHKAASQKLFNAFWNLPPDDPRHNREGVYHAMTIGPQGKRVQVILLDTRYFRSPLKITDQRGAPGKERYLPDDSPDKTMLGEAQWAWLEARLREPADLRLIVSSIQVVADGHGWERWGNFPRERQRLYDLIRITKASGVLFLTGDRHIGGLYRETNGTPYPLHDATGSGLTHAFGAAKEAGPNRLGPLYGAENFGTIDIDWWAESLTLALRNMNGEKVREQKISFAEMMVPP